MTKKLITSTAAALSSVVSSHLPSASTLGRFFHATRPNYMACIVESDEEAYSRLLKEQKDLVKEYRRLEDALCFSLSMHSKIKRGQPLTDLQTQQLEKLAAEHKAHREAEHALLIKKMEEAINTQEQAIDSSKQAVEASKAKAQALQQDLEQLRAVKNSEGFLDRTQTEEIAKKFTP